MKDIEKTIEETFLNCLQSSKKSVETFIEDLDKSDISWIISAVLQIVECKNKGKYVVTSGIGKSGYIAQKISATLASLGIPSFYVHPSEASHGDLGRLQKESIMLILSKSGESKELEDLIKYCNSNSIFIISITSNVYSSLANSSNVVIEMKVEEEACHMNIAPSNSTTLSLIIGDALAITASKLINFTKEDFKNLHPGGKLGITLLKIEDVMNPISKTAIVKENENLREVIIKMTSLRQNGCMVVEEKMNELIMKGIITDFDIRKILSLPNINFENLKAKDIMNSEFYSVSVGTFAIDVLREMTQKRYNIAPVVENKEGKKILYGCIHISKLIEIGLEI